MINPCKRIAQRITETVDLSYQLASGRIVKDSMDICLSETGIAFNSHDPLKEGVTLNLDVLLLSRMKSLNVDCKVVYCRDSNPYETRHHPYRIGGQFLDMKDSDRETIKRHVKRRNLHLWTGYGFWSALVATALFLPEVLWHTLEELLHHALEIVLHVTHLGFEFLEIGLDHAVEHLFHTDLHDTQLIVFYTICSIGFAILALLAKPMFRFLRKRWLKTRIFMLRKSASIRYYWSHQSIIGKLKIVGIAGGAISLYAMFGF